MVISQENEERFTVSMTPRYVGLTFAGVLIVVTLIVYAVASASGAEKRAGGMSRTPDGAPALLLLVGAPVLIFLDWRRNRKSLTFDTVERKVKIVGPKPMAYSIDEIERFNLGATFAVGKRASQIEFQLKDGQSVGSGVNSSFGNAEISEYAIKTLNERLKAASAKV